MNPVHDIVFPLLVTPFSRRNNTEKQDILVHGGPTPAINFLSSDNKDGKKFNRTFKASWYMQTWGVF